MDRISKQTSRHRVRQAAKATEYIRLMDGVGACNALSTLNEAERVGVISQSERDLLGHRIFTRLASDLAQCSRENLDAIITCLKQAALDRSEVAETVLAGQLLKGVCTKDERLLALAETSISTPLLVMKLAEPCDTGQSAESIWATLEAATILKQKHSLA